MNLFVFFLIFIVVALQILIIRKIKWIMVEFENIKCYGDNLFRQNECLLGIYKELKFTTSLPLTRGWAGSPDFLWHLSRQILKLKPKVVVECSCGTSTVVISKSLQVNGYGKVYSLENGINYLENTLYEIKKHDLMDYSNLILSPLVDYDINNEKWPWYSINELIKSLKIDMLVIDGPVMNLRSQARYPAVPLLFNLLSEDAVILLDDARRDDEVEIVKKWIKEYDLCVEKLDCEKGCVLLRKTN